MAKGGAHQIWKTNIYDDRVISDIIIIQIRDGAWHLMIIKKTQLANNAPIGARNTMRQIDKAGKSHFSLINPEPLCLYLKCTIEHFLFDIEAFHQLMRALYAQYVVRPASIGGQPPLDPATHK